MYALIKGVEEGGVDGVEESVKGTCVAGKCFEGET